jgi:hypothetical protein
MRQSLSVEIVTFSTMWNLCEYACFRIKRDYPSVGCVTLLYVKWPSRDLVGTPGMRVSEIREGQFVELFRGSVAL